MSYDECFIDQSKDSVSSALKYKGANLASKFVAVRSHTKKEDLESSMNERIPSGGIKNQTTRTM